jgi:putative membrane protein
MTSHSAGRTALYLAVAVVTLGVAVSGARAAGDNLTMGQGKFLQKASADGIAEVELGKLAREKAMREEVKQFADRMVADHTKANAEVQALAQSNGVKLPGEPDKGHRKLIDKLRKQSGPDFEREYMKHMLHDHEEDVEDFRKQAKAKKPNDVNNFAAKTLPTLQEHLLLAQATYDIAAKGKRTGDRETGSKKK